MYFVNCHVFTLICSAVEASVAVSVVIRFLAHDSIMQSMLYAVTRPSVCLSHRWISQKWLKLGSCNFHL